MFNNFFKRRFSYSRKLFLLILFFNSEFSASNDIFKFFISLKLLKKTRTLLVISNGFATSIKPGLLNVIT